MIYSEAVKWPEVQDVIRQKMLAQPRGYQSELAKAIGRTPGMVNQIVTGHRPLPMEHLDAILASLGMSYEVVLSETEK